MKRVYIHLMIAGSAFVLTVTSFFVTIWGATDEPYTVFRKSDAIVQIGVAMVLMILWLQLAVGITAGIVRRRVSAWWLPLLLWVLISEFYLFQSPIGYVHDITRYVVESH